MREELITSAVSTLYPSTYILIANIKTSSPVSSRVQLSLQKYPTDHLPSCSPSGSHGRRLTRGKARRLPPIQKPHARRNNRSAPPRGRRPATAFHRSHHLAPTPILRRPTVLLCSSAAAVARPRCPRPRLARLVHYGDRHRWRRIRPLLPHQALCLPPHRPAHTSSARIRQ